MADEKKPMKRMLFTFGVAVDTGDPDATQKDMVDKINAVLAAGSYQFMGGPTAVSRTDSREVTPKMMELAKALVDSTIARTKETMQ
jgi:hypothetical protein